MSDGIEILGGIRPCEVIYIIYIEFYSDAHVCIEITDYH